MKFGLEIDIDAIDLANELYERPWRQQAEYVIEILKGLDSEAVSEVAEWAANELGKELRYK